MFFPKLFEFLNAAAEVPYLVCKMAQFKYYGEEADAVTSGDSITAARYIFSSLIQGLNPNKILSKMKI